ncbi:MAG: methylated-DNA--[protein]-cysteine S-methyltransferase [Opitutales bacterium]
MARINDNLFTGALAPALIREAGGGWRTRFGWMRARFVPQGLAELEFCQENSGASARVDHVFAKAFHAWLDVFQRLPAGERWGCLAPQGSDFQRRVWRELMAIPAGTRVSYRELAERIGKPGAARAVGGAVGANPLCLLVPCHRVVQSSGRLGGYRWGAERKRALLDAEATAGTDLRSLFQ